MSLRRVGGLAAIALATLLWMSCGQVYRPVVIPINTIPPNPANFHAVFSVNANTGGGNLSSSIASLSEAASLSGPGGVVTVTLNTALSNAAPGTLIEVSGAAAAGYNGNFVILGVTGGGTSVTYQDPVVGLPPVSGGMATALPGKPSSLVAIGESATGVVTVAVSPPLASAVPEGTIQIAGVGVAGYDGSFVISDVSAGGSTVTYQSSTLNLPAASGGLATVPPLYQGTAMQIDVSGDSEIGAANMGVNPTHGISLPNDSRVFVAAAGSLYQGDADVVTAFTPAVDARVATGFGTTTLYTYPSTGNGQVSNITNLTETSNVVTVTLSSPISTAQVGAEILISAVSMQGYDGTFVISSVSGTTLTYTASTTNLPVCPSTACPPNPNGPIGIATVPVVCSYLPDYLATSQNTVVYVADYGVENGSNCNLSSTDSVGYLSSSLNSITNIGYLPAGSHPVGLVETANAQNLYVLNQGSGTVAPNVTDLSPVDLTVYCPTSAPPCSIPVGANPVWITARPDGQRVYVVSEGTGELYTINTATNTLVSPTPVSLGGPGANFVLYDSSLNRLYATNPATDTVLIFDATTDPPTLISSISIPAPPIPAGTPPCAGGQCSYTSVMPVGVAALIDGSRFYVASYVTSFPGTPTQPASPCPDPNVTATGCIIPQVTVFDANTLAIKTTVFPLIAPLTLTSPVDGVQPFAAAPVAYCMPAIPYSPAFTRFRMFAAEAVDGSHVYASMCDGGAVADIFTTTDTLSVGTNATDILITDLLAPFSAAAPVNGEQPPQFPSFLFTGQ